MARIEFGQAAILRAGARDRSRYVAPSSFHAGAAWLAAAAPLLGILLAIAVR